MIYVNSCGHDSHHLKPCDIEHKNGVPDYLILLIKQEAWLESDGQRQIISPNSLICFPPNTYIHYGRDISGYNDDWVHFLPDAVEADSFQALLPPQCLVLHPHNFHRLSDYVRMLADAFHSNSRYSTTLIYSFMNIFFMHCQKNWRKQMPILLFKNTITNLQSFGHKYTTIQLLPGRFRSLQIPCV